MEGRPRVCKETICKHVHADAKAGGELWKNPPRGHRKRRRRCPRVEGRGRGKIPDQRMIDTRPAEVETRAVGGHREGYLINGAAKTGNLATVVERNTRFTPAGRTDTREAEEVTAVLCAMFLQMPEATRAGLTLDNGKEFARHEEIAGATGLDVFFSHPCHSWERGTNENTNGLIRRLHPERSSFARIGQAGPRRIDRYLNDRPRRCPGRRTPREVMAAFLASVP